MRLYAGRLDPRPVYYAFDWPQQGMVNGRDGYREGERDLSRIKCESVLDKGAEPCAGSKAEPEAEWRRFHGLEQSPSPETVDPEKGIEPRITRIFTDN